MFDNLEKVNAYQVSKNYLINEDFVPKDPLSSRYKFVPDPESGTLAVKYVMIEQSGSGQRGFDEIWKRYQRKVYNLVNSMMKKCKLSYYDLGHLMDQPKEYYKLESDQKTPYQFVKLQYLMQDFIDDVQEYYEKLGY